MLDRSFFLSLFPEGSSNTHGGVGGAQSRPLGTDDLKLIEEDLSKQLSVDTVDRDLELNTEPYIYSLENGGEVAMYILFELYIILIENVCAFLALQYHEELFVADTLYFVSTD